MANANTSRDLAERRIPRPLIPWEPEDTQLPEDVKTWVAVYDELLKFAERQLNRSPHEGPTNPDPDQRLAALIQRLRGRLEFWQQHLGEVGGVELDVRRGLLRFGAASIRLTRRESQLLGFLARHPQRRFTPEQLVVQAWQAPELTMAEVRSYIVRLRRKLAFVGSPCAISDSPPAGYALVMR